MKIHATLISFTEITDQLVKIVVEYAPKLVGAIIVYIIGMWLIKRVCKGIELVMNKRQYEPTLQSFLLALVRTTLSVLLILSVIGMLGVDTTSFAALLAGAGIAIGAALNGTLGNLAGGVMMLIFKPFKKGDLIEAQGTVGEIIELGVFNTVVLTPDKKTVILPNGPLSTGVITNYTSNGFLRVDLVMAIAPTMSIEKARKVATEAMLSHSKVLKEPNPEVSVLKVGDGMVSLAIRPYCMQADYWDVYFGVQELVKNAFDANGVEGPVPHRVIINK
jgi:small conductance mechanosensitive channel